MKNQREDPWRLSVEAAAISGNHQQIGQRQPTKRRKLREDLPDVGSWVELPRLTSESPLFSLCHMRFSGLCGEVVSRNEDKVTLRFYGIDHDAYVARARIVAGGITEIVDFPSALRFRCSWAADGLAASDRLCIYSATHTARAAVLKRQRQKEQHNASLTRLAPWIAPAVE